MTWSEWLSVAVVATDPATAMADSPVASATEPTQRSAVDASAGARHPELTAADVQGDPPPGLESGRTDAPESEESAARIAARVALLVPKLLLEAGLAPMRGLIYADDRYDLQGLYDRTFFNADHTIGLFPTAAYTTGFGAIAGLRFADRDLFGAHESVALQAMTGAITGQPYRASFLASARTGNRLGDWLQLGIDANFDRRPADPFDGIGNGNLAAPTGTLIDPRSDATAVATYNRYQEARIAAVGDLHAGAFHLQGTASLTELSFGSSTTGIAIDQIYDSMTLVGYQQGVRHGYAELAIRWDTRRRRSSWEPTDEHAAGSLAAVSLGRVDRFDGGTDFWHYGLELQHYWRIADGPRVLVARFHGEGVTGSIDDVPFTELPMLGGGTFLRGYGYGRFRDRIAAVGSIQYEWDISHFAETYLFTDAGRVFDSFDALGVDGMRLGFGVGLKLRGASGFLLEGSLASSIDGGVFLSMSFNPVLDTEMRWR